MIELLFRAAATTYGIAVKTSDPLLLRARLYAERRRHPSNPKLEALILSPSHSNPTGELWIINQPHEEPLPSEEKPPSTGDGVDPPL